MKITTTATLGFPRMGPNRELKFALEKHWKGSLSEVDLIKVSEDVETMGWKLQKEAGIDLITVGDMYLYDCVLFWIESLGIVPHRFENLAAGTTRMFSMARGVDGAEALSMKKWITSNYHYMVPEFDKSSKIAPDFSSFISSVERGVGVLGAECAIPVVLGPVSICFFARIVDDALTTHELIALLIPVYKTLLQKVADLGVKEIQIHEPAIVLEEVGLIASLKTVYPAILPKGPKINFVTAMDDVGKANYDWLISESNGLNILSMDFTRGNTLGLIEKRGFPSSKMLGAGLVDARNVWKVDPGKVLPLTDKLKSLGIEFRVQPSTSLQYTPWDLDREMQLDNHPAAQVLSFAKQKLDELVLLAQAISGEKSALDTHTAAWTTFHSAHTGSTLTKERIKHLKETDFRRPEPYKQRRPKQLVGVPLLPTTTIGSFPQTSEIRRLRWEWKKGRLTNEAYERAMDQHIAYCIGIQEAIGIDILVHGEPERTDMVEFFGQQMEGILFSEHGWVQSFGSRCVRPPIIWSDIQRPKAMTVREFKVAQDLTSKPVKGMLTGPITILNWSFPRVDVSRKEQAYQLALAIRDEVADLESAGCKVIQVDEPALREGMPLRTAQKEEYLTWSVDAFRLATAVAASETQIHTHMCYCEFNDCMEAIDRLDTDVNSIENARSDNATLEAFQRVGYEKGFGPGLYDIHSPVVPPIDIMYEKLSSFLKVLDVEHTVVNPDCGLKTRGWPETILALKHMVAAAHNVRRNLGIETQ
ncbi:predicted protein [Phaeodactylum tricornutum CCAP 1055/1]|uniref:5-methyltetrahydropteroyltriglutamate--homocysteine S-methyltransferase n=1 Tax=Phaeodactylum tricornutum (strain CCAP 1055/1) TaxID=556484 RepID=B7G1X4_PHATC|nr:predicted protein [Phaeodactylum tricornutum CCAP 1055/1]EEC47762.1 predicted protein [Phaeodactylum tricornutum CCAP 1055/1]|eukprot:XP_002181110.1 predicted protein [Phaeodactylum tricornutum CCAP 1055/1]